MKSTVNLDKVCECLATAMYGAFIGALIGYAIDTIVKQR